MGTLSTFFAAVPVWADIPVQAIVRSAMDAASIQKCAGERLPAGRTP